MQACITQHEVFNHMHILNMFLTLMSLLKVKFVSRFLSSQLVRCVGLASFVVN